MAQRASAALGAAAVSPPPSTPATWTAAVASSRKQYRCLAGRRRLRIRVRLCATPARLLAQAKAGHPEWGVERLDSGWLAEAQRKSLCWCSWIWG